jgi:hypothetical protein
VRFLIGLDHKTFEIRIGFFTRGKADFHRHNNCCFLFRRGFKPTFNYFDKDVSRYHKKFLLSISDWRTRRLAGILIIF